MKQLLFKIIDNLESVLCQLLLVSFVVLLFAQIVLRNLFSYSLPWGDELATYAFVWFAYLGAVYATKMSAHNRVTFQFKFFPRWVETFCAVLTDMIWIGFNAVFIYLSYDFVFNKMNLFWKSQTLGIPMKYFYLILPIAFIAMTLRILQNNYLKFVKKVDIVDPESQAVEELKHHDDANGDGPKPREQ
ncbi:TRAP transporter small permease [Halomonas stenophila]|uniref:TRAP transporter small permease protein n=1 Tax=Halomonas stenophila TaxID=795312 RepID=A0A7W5HHU5_9GAMM|nr:TRAP transporter small permease [Halomonas stenophila]MBB3229240.1 TRAP-type C4-dicarboxylate transport system permease small subunit [Halomonas stenophila]